MSRSLILSIIYLFNKFGLRPTRRDVATFLYVFLDGELEVEDVYPDGVESFSVNAIVDNLVEEGLIYSDWGKLSVLSDIKDNDIGKLEEFVRIYLRRKKTFWLGLSSFLFYRNIILNHKDFKGEIYELEDFRDNNNGNFVNI